MAAIHAGCQSTPIAAVAMRAGAVGGLNGRGPVAAIVGANIAFVAGCGLLRCLGLPHPCLAEL